ncbi:hypothetical protein Dimus_006752 [Dionaea muscipula]
MGRSPCCEKAHTNKGAWTKEEDQLLIDYIRAHGEGCWRSLPKAAGLLRCGKSCRLRWINYLRPDLKRGNFTEDEDDLIIKLHSLVGNKWSLIAGRLKGRTDNEIKNYWNTHIKRRLLRRGIDPLTHRPLYKTATAAAATDTVITITATCPTPKDDNPDADIEYRIREGVGACSSGTTDDDDDKDDDDGRQGREEGHQTHEGSRPEIDLELSIGLSPFHLQPPRVSNSSTSHSRDGTRPVEFPPETLTGLVAPGICLCCKLGAENGQHCSDCQQSTASGGGYHGWIIQF